MTNKPKFVAVMTLCMIVDYSPQGKSQYVDYKTHECA